MSRNKDGRPEWFKFWRRNRRQLDIEVLSMNSRGIIFTNMMRYFDGEDALLPMSDLETIAFNVVKINVDDAFDAYADRAEINRENGQKGGRPPKSAKNQMGYQKPEDRYQKEDYRIQSEKTTPDMGWRTERPLWEVEGIE